MAKLPTKDARIVEIIDRGCVINKWGVRSKMRVRWVLRDGKEQTQDLMLNIGESVKLLSRLKEENARNPQARLHLSEYSPTELFDWMAARGYQYVVNAPDDYVDSFMRDNRDESEWRTYTQIDTII